MRRRIVEMHIRMACQPHVSLRLVRGQIVEDYVDLLALILLNHAVHEIEESQSTAAFVMPTRYLTRAHVQRGEQGGGAVPLIVVRRPIIARPLGNFRYP